MDPKNSFFVKSAAVPAKKEASPDAKASLAEPPASLEKEKREKEDNTSKKTESAGLSPAEKKELEHLKDIVERKAPAEERWHRRRPSEQRPTDCRVGDEDERAQGEG